MNKMRLLHYFSPKAFSKSLLTVLMLSLSVSVFAESFTCPTIKAIKDRTISQEFDWTVSEETSLDAVLNVTELSSVSLHNHGEFVSCHYKSGNEKVRLDAKPLTVDCLLVPESANWDSNESGESVCNDPTKYRCKFEVSCQLIIDGS